MIATEHRIASLLGSANPIVALFLTLSARFGVCAAIIRVLLQFPTIAQTSTSSLPFSFDRFHHTTFLATPVVSRSLTHC
jgi:hypothetical protein